MSAANRIDREKEQETRPMRFPLVTASYGLDEGADINARDTYGGTALIWAAGKGRLNMVKFLLEKGANINATKDWHWGGDTALAAAAEYGHGEVVRLLRKREASLTLPAAAILGDHEEAGRLISIGADVNAKDGFGRTALTRAVSAGELEMVKFLIDKGADLNAKPEWGETALQVAKKKGYKEIEQLLKARGAKE